MSEVPDHCAFLKEMRKKRAAKTRATARKRARSAKFDRNCHLSDDDTLSPEPSEIDVGKYENQPNLSKAEPVPSDEVNLTDIDDQEIFGYDFIPLNESDSDSYPEACHRNGILPESSTIDEDDADLPSGEEDASESDSSYYDEENTGIGQYEVQDNTTVNGTENHTKRKPCVKAMGEVRLDEDGKLEWQDPVSQQWYPAVRHTDIREWLIAEAAKLGKYRYPMARGKHPLDVTAFHPAFKDYSDKRENWPKILFQYLPRQSDLSHVKPDYWQLHDGRYVIDLNNQAMYDYPHMPVTLAKHADTWLLLTLMRMNTTISIQDLRGRMIGGMDRSRSDPMGRNRISMNMQRFRKFACCLTWTSIQANNVQRDYLDKKLPRRCLRENSTESFRMLYAHEAAELDLVDAGKFLHRTRAKVRDLSEGKSKAVYKRKLREYEVQRERFERKFPDGGPGFYDTEDEEFQAKREEEGDGVFKPDRKSEKVNVLPDLSGTSSGIATKDSKEEKLCPRGHRNYAGFLTTAPNTVQQAQLLYDLLRPTREHFKSVIGTYPPKTAGDECDVL